MGYSPWGHREVAMAEVTEHTHTHDTHVCIVSSIIGYGKTLNIDPCVIQ